MKIKFPKIKKNFRKEGFKINPDTYWAIIVGLFFVIIIGSFVFAYNLFKETSRDDTLPTESQSGRIEREKKAEINKVLDYFATRAQKSTQILNSPAPVVDPSL